MEIFLVFLLIVFIAAYRNAVAETERSKDALVKTISKTCPPHQWYYHEVKDHEGEIHAWKMVCKVCGPLKPIGGTT